MVGRASGEVPITAAKFLISTLEQCLILAGQLPGVPE